MIKIYMVFINFGFGGVKYFQKRKNAEIFAREVGEKVEQETATPREYATIPFDDWQENALIENIGVPFDVINF